MAAEQSGATSARQVLGLSNAEKLVVKDVITDPNGATHVRYDRTFNGLRVIGGDFVSHRDSSGRVKDVSWNGAREVAVGSTKPRLSMSSAKATGANAAAALAHQSTTGDKAELVVYAGGSGGASGMSAKPSAAVKRTRGGAASVSTRATAKLAYDVLTVGVGADQTPSRLHTIVDASTGATLQSFDEIEKGTGNGIYTGAGVTIGTTAGPPHSLRDTAGNVTTDLNHAGDGTGEDLPAVAGTTFTDADDSWGNGTVGDPASVAVDAHYGAEKTFDYFHDVLGRNGIWNTGAGARSRVHYGNGYDNAFWDWTQMTYGDGVGNNKPLVELDIAGHEMSHGVTENTAGLVGDGEAGGLNEGTSDIFGTAVEWYAGNASDTPDYLIGERVDVNGDGTPLRYMDRPSRDGVSPDCWSPTVAGLDPHDADGPLIHWFYLASEGSGAKNINGVSYDSPTCGAPAVTAIGRDKAAKIWYRALTTYLTSNSTYAAAREAAIQSAKDLYGPMSAECRGIASSFSAIAVPVGAGFCGTHVQPSGSNLLSNPGFESGNTFWSATSDVIGMWGPEEPAHSGTRSAWMGGYGESNTDSMSQLVTIPAGSSATLSYYVHVDTFEA
ncbi:MAG: hypothetical protein QOE58_942, partial [Actinomycetota bacterium]|nr:hypothetical protein [Actinomycetota bacterium]